VLREAMKKQIFSGERLLNIRLESSGNEPRSERVKEMLKQFKKEEK
jgi:hypothetical protein